MKKNGFLALGLAIGMSLSMPFLSYADSMPLTIDPFQQPEQGCPLKIFGQGLVETGNSFSGGMRMIVIVAGADRIEDSDLDAGSGRITKKELNTENGKLPEFNAGNKLHEFEGGHRLLGGADYIEVEDPATGFKWDILVCRVPASMTSTDELREYKKYVISTNGYQNKASDLGWQKDENGWWYNRGNGAYPVNEWQEDNGKSYYFGYEGYMWANTWTPDGYFVDASGAWVPGYDEGLVEGAVIRYTKSLYNEAGLYNGEEKFSVPVQRASDINKLYDSFTENDQPEISRLDALTLYSERVQKELSDHLHSIYGSGNK